MTQGRPPALETLLALTSFWLHDFYAGASSPAFVRRVIRDAGSEGIARLYFLPDGEDGIEYLLRRFKGHYYRNRYPCISLW